MSKQRANAAGGGFLIAMGALIGAFGGAFLHESTRGLFAGFGVGVLLAILLWIRDRRREARARLAKQPR